jgi:hypothetical protein
MLVDFASIEIAEIGLTIHHIAIHEKGSARWARLPARPQLRDAFSAAAIKAVFEHAPDAFDRGHQALPKAKEA